MKPVFYITNKQPVSVNTRKVHVKYEEVIQTDFIANYSSLYENLPIESGDLKTRITYIFDIKFEDQIPDIDNLSKPIIDAFRGIIYKDDKQVVDRNATRIRLEDFDFQIVDASNMPYPIYSKLDSFYRRKEKHIVLLGVSTTDTKTIRVGEI